MLLNLNMKKSFYILVLCIASLGTNSCFTVTNLGSVSRVGSSQASLSGTSWEVEGIHDYQVRPHINFDNEKGISGNAGCNSFFSGNVAVKSAHGEFSVKQIASTQMLCPSEVMKTERNFIKILESADGYVINKNKLELFKGNILLIKFRNAKY